MRKTSGKLRRSSGFRVAVPGPRILARPFVRLVHGVAPRAKFSAGRDDRAASRGIGSREEARSEKIRTRSQDPANRSRSPGRHHGVTRQRTGKANRHGCPHATQSGDDPGNKKRPNQGNVASRRSVRVGRVGATECAARQARRGRRYHSLVRTTEDGEPRKLGRRSRLRRRRTTSRAATQGTTCQVREVTNSESVCLDLDLDRRLGGKTAERDNGNRAYRKVTVNKSSPVVDGVILRRPAVLGRRQRGRTDRVATRRP